jgi:hypothetical protein
VALSFSIKIRVTVCSVAMCGFETRSPSACPYCKYAILASALDWLSQCMLDGTIEAPAPTPLFWSSKIGTPREATP